MYECKAVLHASLCTSPPADGTLPCINFFKGYQKSKKLRSVGVCWPVQHATTLAACMPQQLMRVLPGAPRQGLPLHALTGYEDGSVALWDTRSSSTYLAAQKLHSEPVMCLAAAADCSRGLSGSADDKLASFDLDIARGQLRAGAVHVLPQQGLADVAVRPDGRIAATAGWDAKVRVWHVRKRQPLAILRWHSQQVACVGFSRDSMLLAAGGRDNAISMWSLYPPNVPGS